MRRWKHNQNDDGCSNTCKLKTVFGWFAKAQTSAIWLERVTQEQASADPAKGDGAAATTKRMHEL